jgi:hypothetical protein
MARDKQQTKQRDNKPEERKMQDAAGYPVRQEPFRKGAERVHTRVEALLNTGWRSNDLYERQSI